MFMIMIMMMPNAGKFLSFVRQSCSDVLLHLPDSSRGSLYQLLSVCGNVEKSHKSHIRLDNTTEIRKTEILDDKINFVFVYDKSHAQVYEKSKLLSGGTVEEFRKSRKGR